MYYHQPLLLTPGPTPVPDAIMREIQALWLVIVLRF